MRLLKMSSSKYYNSPKHNNGYIYNSLNFFPFSLINVSKNRTKINENLANFINKEEKCISLIDMNIISDRKRNEIMKEDYEDSSFDSNPSKKK